MLRDVRLSAFRRRSPLALVAMTCLGGLLLPPDGADARVNPLVVIQRQIHKANMLIVLDTSGSMTGVPGGVFTYSTEAGVDCDNGSNCRNGGVAGICGSQTSRSCLSDDDCRRGYCEKDPGRTCSADNDCVAPLSTCSATGLPCASNNDCSPQPGKCTGTGLACASNADCPPVGKCTYGNTVCNNVGGKCPDIGTCKQDSTKTCMGKEDCPQSASGGNCAGGGTPPSGCSTQEDCPSKKQCEHSGETCRDTMECPGPTNGRCSVDGSKCKNDKQCGGGQTCIMWTNTCQGAPNPCTLPHTPCDMHTDNFCVGATNTCDIPTNTCLAPPADRCIPPASTTDVCKPSPKGTPGPIRMCRIAQTVCTRNDDCKMAGDACGPATSRAVIAKRAINSLITNNYDIVNFGMMTFWQSGYFPYFQAESGGTTGTITEFVAKDKLKNADCLMAGWGPKPVCRISGIEMKLRALQNSRYLVRTGPSSYVDADQNWCGQFCDIKPSIGTGEYQGSYYEYSGGAGGNSTTKLEQETYSGKNITVGGVNYTYFQARPNYYNGGRTPPFEFANCEETNACGTQCGGRWDKYMGPFLDTTDKVEIAREHALTFAERLEPASYGGLMFYWGTPVGCTLLNSGAPDLRSSAYHYMQTVQSGNAGEGIPKDPLECRQNFVLLITDGQANGPGDVNCESAACAAANPETAGCKCRSVLAAWRMRQDLGVRTFVVGFSGDVSAGTPRIVNDNIARAGGTDAGNDGVGPFAFLAQREDELLNALQMAVYDAVRGSYSTAPTSTSAGTQQVTTIAEGKYALDSRMDFPSWKGHLLAYDMTSGAPTLAWDAATSIEQMNWWERRVYTWDGAQMVQVKVDPQTKAVSNKDQLAALGLGATADEAEAVARWMLGDPTYGNPAVLGAIINSTPIDVAGPGNFAELPGGFAFFNQYRERPHLVYVGSDNGMLHAFLLEQTTVGAATYPAGTEAFAFIPPDMLSMVRKLYAQGGQRPDPNKHIFGLAQSPKVKHMCIKDCADAEKAYWRSLLVMPQGYGGSNTFMLDITEPFGSAGINSPPVKVLWHSDYVSASSYNDTLGLTVSLPAFFLNKTDTLEDYRLIFGSGYPVSADKAAQGKSLVIASARSGSVLASHALTPSGDCPQEFTMLADVATARDFARGEAQKLLAAYTGDTWGNLWRYTLGKGLERVASLGCSQPLHFSPTVVQLDRDHPDNHPHEIYTVQVTNSALDLETASFGPSRMVIAKEIAVVDENGQVTGVEADLTFGQGGRFVLDTDDQSEICAQTQKSGDSITCSAGMPAGARPTATPLGILRKHGDGFQVLSLWYVPAPNGCTKGATYLTIHEMKAGEIEQRMGAKVAEEPVTSPVIMNGHVYVFGSSGAIDVTDLIPDPISAGQARPPVSYDGMFSRMSWIEVQQ